MLYALWLDVLLSSGQKQDPEATRGQSDVLQNYWIRVDSSRMLPPMKLQADTSVMCQVAVGVVGTC